MTFYYDLNADKYSRPDLHGFRPLVLTSKSFDALEPEKQRIVDDLILQEVGFNLDRYDLCNIIANMLMITDRQTWLELGMESGIAARMRELGFEPWPEHLKPKEQI